MGAWRNEEHALKDLGLSERVHVITKGWSKASGVGLVMAVVGVDLYGGGVKVMESLEELENLGQECPRSFEPRTSMAKIL